MSVEPDNNIQNANDTRVNSDGERSIIVNGAIDFGNDVDLYQFQANAGEDVILDLDANEFGSSLDGRLRLFDSLGNEIGNNDDRPAPGEASSLDAFLSFTPSSSANYYVGVSNISNSDYDPNVVSDEASTQAVLGEYALEISLVDENSGSDPDNTIAEAIATRLDAPGQSASFSDEIDNVADVDIYQVQLDSGDALVVDVDAGAAIDSDLFVSDLRIFDVDEPTDEDSNADPDGTIASAIALELEDPGDTVTLNDAIAFSEDIDLYSVRLEAGEGLTFDIDSNEQGSGLDSRLRLFDADGNEIDGSDDDIAPGEEFSLDPFLSFTADTAGDYYIGVSEFSNFAYDPVTGGQTNDVQGNTGEYTLEASLFTEEVEVPTPENPDREDNTISGATATGLDDIGQSATFSNAIEPIADVDLYQVQLEAGEGLILDVDAAELLSPEESASSLDSLLRLFDADGNEVAINDDGSAPGEEFSLDSYLTFTANSSGDYYVGVSSLANSSYDPMRVETTDVVNGNTGDYDLNLEIVEVVTLDEDPDNTIAEAIAEVIDSPGQSATFSDAIEPETDADLYQVRLDVGDNLLIDLDANEFGSSLDGRLRLFDAIGNELASVDDLPAPGEEFSLDSFIDFTAEVAGDYYVGVSDFTNSQYDPSNGITNISPPTGNTTGNYDLTIEIAGDSAELVFADFDRITGTDNPDVLSGNSDSTFIDANGGDDVVTGASNDDYLVGGAGSDILSGNNGNDTLIGGLGFDVLSGGEGDDFLQGDEDTNTLFGGVGADIFAIADNGNNTIADFELGTDKIQLVGSASFADLTIEDIAGGSGVVISSSSNNSITTVPGIIANNLAQTDFLAG